MLVFFSAVSSAGYCSLLWDGGLLVAVSCALKVRIPVFSQVEVVFILKPNESIG